MVAQYVLQDFAKADGDWLDDLMRGVADGAPDLAAGHADKFQNAVARRMAPAKPEKPAPKVETQKPAKAQEPVPEDERTPLQKLVDKFR
jgi:PTH1 family peptidyl-tRNA hydrolase